MKVKTRILPGTTSDAEQEYEILHRKTARKAAAEGMVLLKNDNHVLPIKKGEKLALYGAGAAVTVKGGMGSGDVNARETVSVYEGLKNAGYEIVNTDWITDYKTTYEKARLDWRQVIWDKMDASTGEMLSMFRAYSSTPFIIPGGRLPEKTEADIGLYVLSRNAGEGSDRNCEKGDYLLTDEEKAALDRLSELYKHIVLLLNVGGVMDLSFLEAYENIDSILYIHQSGMEAGNAVADVISGAVTPSGKLTDSWAYNYEDYPNSKTFSHNNGNVKTEEYIEGIYVGYRYFDTYDVPVRYGFGYGLSYTSFCVDNIAVTCEKEVCKNSVIEIAATVKNIGNVYSGKDILQVYVCPPQEKLAKEYRRLVAFGKSVLLKPGETSTVNMSFSVTALASFDQEKESWFIENGKYGIFLGESLESARLVAGIEVAEEIEVAKMESVCASKKTLDVLKGNRQGCEQKRKLWMEKGIIQDYIPINKDDVVKEVYNYSPSYNDMPKEVYDFVDTLTEKQLILLATGNVNKAQGSALGSAGVSVPGSAAETSDCALEQNLAPVVLADGPAGLRLGRTYRTQNGEILPLPSGAGLENGFLCREKPQEGTVHYQYCTAFPVGTLLAQSWDEALLEEVGKAVAEELKRFGVTLWLAPGMNIHRNPLCGRNFEYYSEDPVVSGNMAAAITKGVQSVPGYGTTIKHFACNNQEDNRMGSDSVLDERTLREIYLKGFEIAIKESAPMAIMTSYNLINGIHAANSYDLCTKILRNEWHYKGYVMTDWTTTMQGDGCTASGCMRAGNDGVMPGCVNDHTNIKEELESGRLDIRDLKRSVARLVNLVWKSDVYEK